MILVKRWVVALPEQFMQNRIGEFKNEDAKTD
jgi:hypothetical protein